MLTRIYNQILNESSSSKTFVGLDALRGWAIMAVVMLHAGHLGLINYGQKLNIFIESGQLGVQLFYIISSFSLCLSLQERKGESHWLGKYLLRRIFRIAPLYFLIVLYYIWPNPSEYSWEKIVTVFTLTNGFFPNLCTGIANGSWSISVEFVFYCLLPVIFLYFNSANKLILLLGISCFLAAKTITSGHPNAYYYITYQLGVFLIGCLAYYFWANPKYKISAIYVFPLVVYIFLGKPPHQHFVFGTICCLLLYSAIQNPQNFVLGKPIQYIGKVSYGIYLIHFIVTDKLDQMNPQYLDFGVGWLTLPARFSLVLLISTILATISYIAIERPAIRWGRKLISMI
ncbi:MAG: acyltransferase [Bdellovibrionaceae bacterium]|nr:acyltransferase [Pseudobdellovibrionaceae bacterium]